VEEAAAAAEEEKLVWAVEVAVVAGVTATVVVTAVAAVVAVVWSSSTVTFVRDQASGRANKQSRVNESRNITFSPTSISDPHFCALNPDSDSDFDSESESKSESSRRAMTTALQNESVDVAGTWSCLLILMSTSAVIEAIFEASLL